MATAWSSFNGKISKARETSEWLFDVTSRYEPALSFRASTAPSTICLLYLSPSLLFFPFLISSPPNVSPFSRFDHLLVCMCAAEVSRLRSFYSWSESGCVYSRIRLDNKLPESKRRKSRSVKEREMRINTDGRKRRESKKRASIEKTRWVHRHDPVGTMFKD